MERWVDGLQSSSVLLLRLVRQPHNLLYGDACSGEAAPADIALAAASTVEYDDFFVALRSDANIDLHFVNGIKIWAEP